MDALVKASLDYFSFEGERIQNCQNEDEALDVTFSCSRIKDKVNIHVIIYYGIGYKDISRRQINGSRKTGWVPAIDCWFAGVLIMPDHEMGEAGLGNTDLQCQQAKC